MVGASVTETDFSSVDFSVDDRDRDRSGRARGKAGRAGAEPREYHWQATHPQGRGKPGEEFIDFQNRDARPTGRPAGSGAAPHHALDPTRAVLDGLAANGAGTP